MKVKKAGCILINLENKKIGLVYRKKGNDYSIPKGHLENGETLEECALRETEEETGRKCHLIEIDKVNILEYITPRGEDVEVYFYFAIDDGESDKIIPEELQEELIWVDSKDVKNKLTYDDLIKMWNKVESYVNFILEK